MTQDLEPATDGTTYYRPQYEPTPPVVRGMPTNARGTRGALQAGEMLDLGSVATASGYTRAQVTGLLDDLQETSLNTVLAALPKILRRNAGITQARINEISTRVDRLRRVHLAQPQTGLRGFLGMAPNMEMQPEAPAYVSLAEVQMLFAEAIAALASTD
jgi:hypothetical protein